ncbi:MAG: hypothetical protein JSS49_20770 [Planctomycetes bacterium]|nr:hypothetical protein [Planctomycetota bacterium]
MDQPIATHRIELLDPEVVAMLKMKTPAQRLQIAFAMQRFARAVLFSRIRSQHSGWTDEEIDTAVAKRMSRGEL